LLAMNETTGKLTNIKISSTPKHPSEGVLGTMRELLNFVGRKEISSVTHATTIAVNALLGQLGLELPRTALLTTKGFKDILEIGRQRRPELYNLKFRKPRPLIPRRHRYEVSERIGAKGEEVEPLDTEEIVRLGRSFADDAVKSVAVGFVNSYMQPSHELEAEALLRRISPQLRITLSSDLTREYREYERISTAAVNASLMPIISSYLEELIAELKKSVGIESPFTIMQSNGGIASVATVTAKPATMIESGPAAGVVAASFYSQLVDAENILSFDMGGTTAKAGVVRDGIPGMADEYEVGGKIHSGRIVKGSGYPIRFPFIDLAECGAGGGTIAWVDEAGGLQIGPMSAGADPGPACYGRGGENPTVTDANVVLGRLNPKYLLGGKLRIRKDLAEKSIQRFICKKTGLDLIEAASGIIRIAVSEINKIMRIVSVERGVDPRLFTLIAFGGAGPMHSCILAEELSVNQVVIPPNPGLFSALGLLVADYVHYDSRPILRKIRGLDAEKSEALFTKMEANMREVLLREGVEPDQIVFERQIDARYQGQAYELQVHTIRPFDDMALSEVEKQFHMKHKSVYGYSSDDEEVEAVNMKIVGRGITRKPTFTRKTRNQRQNAKVEAASTRTVYLDEKNSGERWLIYDREMLQPGDILDGPAIVEQYDSTTVIMPEWKCEVDDYGNLRLLREEARLQRREPN
jgi:N-methylhydantoinase A